MDTFKGISNQPQGGHQNLARTSEIHYWKPRFCLWITVRLVLSSAIRSTMNWLLARRSVAGAASQIHRELNHGETGCVVGAASQFRHESNHGETGKGGPLWGLNPSVPVWPNHGAFGAISWWFGTNSWRFEIMAFSRFGGPETASPTGQAHPHSEGHGLENPKD